MWKKVGNSLKRRRDKNIANPDAMISVNLANTNENLITTKSARARKLTARHKKMFIAIYSVLGAAIVGLAVAIVTVNVNNGDVAIADGASECSGSNDEEQMVEVSNTITDTTLATRDMPFDEALAYINDKISEYADTDYEFGMRMIKVYLLINQGDAEAAYEASTEVPLDMADAVDMLDYYRAMVTISESLDDNDAATRYQELIETVSQEIGGESV